MMGYQERLAAWLTLEVWYSARQSAEQLERAIAAGLLATQTYPPEFWRAFWETMEGTPEGKDGTG